MFNWLRPKVVVQPPSGLTPTEAAQWIADFEKAQKIQKDIEAYAAFRENTRRCFGGGMRE